MLLDDKNERLELVFVKNDYQRLFFKAKQIHLNSLIAHFEAEELTFDPEDTNVLLTRFQEFFNEIFQRAYYRYRFPLQISDALLEAMLLTLIHNNNMERATKLLQLFNTSPLFDKYNVIIGLIRRLKIEKYKDDVEAVQKTLCELEEAYQYKGQVEIERTKYWYMVQKGTFLADDSIVNNALAENNNDVEIEKYIGDYYYHNQNIIEATKRYRRARRGRNGMLLKDLDSKGIFNGETIRGETIAALQLLDEFSQICDKYDVSYIVGGVIPKIVRRKRMENFGFVQVYMTTDQMLEFLKAADEIEQKQDRAIEYFGNNSVFPFFSIRYVNKKTSAFRLEDAYNIDGNGIYVEVLPIRGKIPSSVSLVDIIEKGKMLNSIMGRKRYAFINKEKKVLIELSNRVFAKKDNKANKRLFIKLCNYYKLHANDDNAWIYNANWNRRVIPVSLLECSNISLLGHTIRIPKDIKAYNKQLYYEPKAEKNFHYPKLYTNYYRILDLNNSYDETIGKINENDNMLEDAYNYARKVNYYDSHIMKRKATYDIVWNEIGRLYSKE